MEICMILRLDCDMSDRSVCRFADMFSERPLIERVTGVGVSFPQTGHKTFFPKLVKMTF